MAFTKEIYYEGSSDAAQVAFSANWSAQTFTTVGAFTATKVGFYGGVRGTPTGPTLALYATTAGKPSGAALTTEPMVIANMPAYDSPDWYEVELSTPVALSATTQYALVMYTTSGSTPNEVWWRYDNSSPSYADGTFVFSGNSGSTWTIVSGYDFLFRIYSGSGVVYVDASGSATLTFSSTAILSAIRDVSASTTLTFSSTAILTSGPLTGAGEEKFTKYLVAFGNDTCSYESG